MRSGKAKRQEGAAMLIVMLVILMSTATATFAIQSTGIELRAAGHERQATQTHYLTENGIQSALMWVDQTTPTVLAHVLQSSTPPDLSAHEPALLTGKQAYRLVLDDFGYGSYDPQTGEQTSAPPVDSYAGYGSLGKVPYEADFTVDITDNYTFTGTVPGYRLDGGGALRYMVATYTVRGRTAIPQYGQVNEMVSAMDAVSVGRVFARSGPMPK